MNDLSKLPDYFDFGYRASFDFMWWQVDGAVLSVEYWYTEPPAERVTSDFITQVDMGRTASIMIPY